MDLGGVLVVTPVTVICVVGPPQAEAHPLSVDANRGGGWRVVMVVDQIPV